MTDPIDLLRRAGEAADRSSPRSRPSGWPTGCTGWNVRDVINHLANWNLRFAAEITRSPAPIRVTTCSAAAR